MIITDQWNQISRLYELQVTVIYSRAIVVTVTSESSVRWFLKKLDQNFRTFCPAYTQRQTTYQRFDYYEITVCIHLMQLEVS